LTPEDRKPLEITIAITGASGAIYPCRLLKHLAVEPLVNRIYLVASAAGLRVLHEELNVGTLSLNNLAENLTDGNGRKVTVLSNNDIGARIASGSYPVDAMVIIPCSMGTLGSIAHGISRDLIQRAADVILKERRKLLLVTRDTPFNLIHIENMKLLTVAGGIIFPAVPSFYHKPVSLEDAVDQFLYRVMQHLGLNPRNAYRWKGSGDRSE
jgi:4-hydroxy-3-polyprenylbenzoate decarboxylase